MSDLLSVVVDWIAVTLLGVAGGSVASILGYGSLTALMGAVGLLVGGTFVFGSILASYASVFRRADRAEMEANGSTLDLAGEGLLRATVLGFLSAGAIVGSLGGNELTAIACGVTGAVAIVLSRR